MYKRRRSTIALLKNTITQTKLNKVKEAFNVINQILKLGFIILNILFKSDSSIKCVTSDAEAFLIYIGVVDYLDRPGKSSIGYILS